MMHGRGQICIMIHGHTLDIIDVHGELGILTGLLVEINTFIPSVAEATMFMCKNAFLHSCLEQLIAVCQHGCL